MSDTTTLRERLLAAAELVEHTDDDGRSAAFVQMHHQALATNRPDPEIDMLTQEEADRASRGLPIWP